MILTKQHIKDIKKVSKNDVKNNIFNNKLEELEV